MMLRFLVPVAALAAIALGASTGTARPVAVPAPAKDVPAASGMQTAVFAGGCFWGMEAVFEHLKGVRSVTSGYAGGTRETANYAAVSSERIRHAEAIRVTYDPRQISYGTLLRVLFSVAHDPTQVDGQYPDSGPSYRSAIFPQNAQQRAVAAAYIAQLGKAGSFGKPIATRLESGTFFPAEAYHQDFARRNPNHGYIARWDRPKVAALKASYPTLVR